MGPLIASKLRSVLQHMWLLKKLESDSLVVKRHAHMFPRHWPRQEINLFPSPPSLFSGGKEKPHWTPRRLPFQEIVPVSLPSFPFLWRQRVGNTGPPGAKHNKTSPVIPFPPSHFSGGKDWCTLVPQAIATPRNRPCEREGMVVTLTLTLGWALGLCYDSTNGGSSNISRCCWCCCCCCCWP